MPTYETQNPSGSKDSGQADRFTSAFNPAFSFIVDAEFEYLDNSKSPDGAEARLNVLEFMGSSWVDPSAWAYFIGAAEDEALNIEEAAVHYIGFGGHQTLRAGRFFVDFGKQMQTHIHELRTNVRPLALRTYLGDEIKGDGLQWDDWTSLGNSTAVRWSIGAFSSLLPEAEEDFDATTEVAEELASSKKIDDFNYTARLTGFTDAGESGTFQLGASAYIIPSFDFLYEPSSTYSQQSTGLTNIVYGLDATYGWVGDTGEQRWTSGAELLLNTGDNGVGINDPDGNLGTGDDETLQVFDESTLGYVAWSDFQWNRYNSIGLQFSAVELADATQSMESEIEAYLTHKLSEFQRVRLIVSNFESDVNEDAMRAVVQYTVVLGAHGHGVNW